MKGFYSRDKRRQFEDRLKLEQEKFEQDLQRAKAQKTKLTLGIQNLKEHSKVLEAQKRLQALQKEEKERLKVKDNRDYYLNFLRNQRFTKEDSKSNNLQALDLGFTPQSRIPKPSQAILVKLQPSVDSKIPKLFKNLPEIPEKSENLPWKKGDLLDSLDLSSTNMKILFQNRPKLCESPGREKEQNSDWLKENFRESINEWAPKKIEPMAEVKPTKRVVPRNLNKIGIVEKIEELKDSNKVENTEKKVKFVSENKEKGSKRYETGEEEEEENGRGRVEARKEAVEGQKAGNSAKKCEEKQKGEEKEKVLAERPVFDVVVPEIKDGVAGTGSKPVKKSSKFVNKIKAIPVGKDDFLDCELQCVNDEEAKLQASLARLDIKSLRLKHQTELAYLETQAKQLEESIRLASEFKEPEEIPEEIVTENGESPSETPENLQKTPPKLNPYNQLENPPQIKQIEKVLERPPPAKQSEKILEKPKQYEKTGYKKKHEKITAEKTGYKKVYSREMSPGEADTSTNVASQAPDNASVFSAHPYPRQRPSPESRSVISEYPDRPRNCYSRKEVHRIGAVYNEVAARSGRYGDKNPAPEYALPKNESKESISLRKPPPGPEYTTEVVRVNPNINLKSLFQD